MSRINNTGRYTIANVSAVLMTIFLSSISVFGAMEGHGATVAGSVLFATIVMALLIFSFQAIKDFTKLAFFVPFVLFVLNSAVLATNPQHAYFYLLACLFICGIGCLYTNFPQTLFYMFLQTVTILVLYLLGFPVTGHDAQGTGLLGIFFLFLASCLFLLVITKKTTTSLNKATNEANSFRTYLSTTKDYLAMLDNSNRIVYISKPLATLARIENPELTRGRPFVDLFPGMELKLLAYNMLGRRELHEENWEFTIYRQKRFFKAVSSGMVGGARGNTLISMLDMTHLAERDEVAAMRDSLKIGIFFMGRDYLIQDNYSRFLEEVLSDHDLKGKCFIDLLKTSLAAKELEAIKDYLGMVFDRAFDQTTLQEINPLNELRYVDSSGVRKIFQCEFSTVDVGKGETFILATIYDITVNTELQERLQREERKRQEEMSNLFELLQANPVTFKTFQEDVKDEFSRVDDSLGNSNMSNHEILVEVYQSIHAIKSNAVTIGLRTFGSKVHEVESMIKKLRNIEGEIPFDEMLSLTIEIEKLVQENEGFSVMLEKINAFKSGSGIRVKSREATFLESLINTATKVATDTEKKVRFVASDVDPEALEKGPRRVMKEVLMQLVRNSVVHGVEGPEERVSRGKNETGTIRLSIRQTGDNIHIRLGDDGNGIDFDKVREKAVGLNMIKEDDVADKNRLLNAIFSPGFSTADDEGMHAGRGIGLNLVRDWVRNANGTIKLQTESGKGTVFNIILPAGNAETMDKAS
ncbi:MAG: ATP-binding protein [Treponema sp.]|nr:ATP-binding protein [Treponema sp.]